MIRSGTRIRDCGGRIMGIGDWAQSPIPIPNPHNPSTTIPNPDTILFKIRIFFFFFFFSYISTARAIYGVHVIYCSCRPES